MAARAWKLGQGREKKLDDLLLDSRDMGDIRDREEETFWLTTVSRLL